jgi:hypothetical protein
MRENLLKEKHSRGLVGHFGHDKTFAKLSESYFWPGMRADVKKFVDRCRICQHLKGQKAECRSLSAITHTREAMGGDQHGFCIGFVKDAKGS